MTGACPVFVALKYGISGLSPTSAAFMLSKIEHNRWTSAGGGTNPVPPLAKTSVQVSKRVRTSGCLRCRRWFFLADLSMVVSSSNPMNIRPNKRSEIPRWALRKSQEDTNSECGYVSTKEKVPFFLKNYQEKQWVFVGFTNRARHK
uniref:Uncharacterized protein n=1 Tax=Opuntia streptacantha TaxID=393608 RepID=A0A7C9DG83_OPUST